ncbi:hypothetical protein [Thermoactinospora rubra]|uniref:hypothetical protein n=1 Tax=Thermoactinospora rubra TaxID=1088767 RepID=UPI000A10F4A9|nr:hypothetical protein [Thermoactinospora rubra]
MTWFKVDDSFYDHPKVFDAPDCAVALWVRAGAWSARNLTDGFVPAKLPARMCDDPETAVRELVDRGLWRRTRGGYQFHDWTTYQPSAEKVRDLRRKRAEAGRKGGQAKAANQTADNRLANASGVAKQNPAPSRPDPKGRTPTGFDPRGGTQSSSLTDRNARATQDDDDSKIDHRIIELLRELTGRTVTPAHAATIRRQILDGRAVDKPLNYVSRAIRERPRDFLPADAPRETCPIHLLEQPCRSCAADLKAGS